MQADYGYTVSQVAGGKVLTVKQQRSVARAGRIILFGTLAFVGFLLMWALDSIHNGNRPNQPSHFLAYYCVFVALCAGLWIYLASRPGRNEQKFALSATQMTVGHETYDKRDIRDVCVQAPNEVIVTGRNQLELQSNANLANLAAAQNYSVVFSYGLKRAAIAKFLTEPQAHAVAGEVATWLAT